jgi:hypothetical protein
MNTLFNGWLSYAGMSVNTPTKGWLTFTGILVFLYPEQDFLFEFLEWLTFTGMVAHFEPEYPVCVLTVPSLIISAKNNSA